VSGKVALEELLPTQVSLDLNWLHQVGEDFIADVRIWWVHVDGDHPKPDCSEDAWMELKAL